MLSVMIAVITETSRKINLFKETSNDESQTLAS